MHNLPLSTVAFWLGQLGDNQNAVALMKLHSPSVWRRIVRVMTLVGPDHPLMINITTTDGRVPLLYLMVIESTAVAWASQITRNGTEVAP